MADILDELVNIVGICDKRELLQDYKPPVL